MELHVDAGKPDDVTEGLDQTLGLENRLAHDFTLRIHWSAATARMTRMPTARTW